MASPTQPATVSLTFSNQETGISNQDALNASLNASWVSVLRGATPSPVGCLWSQSVTVPLAVAAPLASPVGFAPLFTPAARSDAIQHSGNPSPPCEDYF